jgi:uncharacterized damage-inducible protein DinB
MKITSTEIDEFVQILDKVPRRIERAMLRIDNKQLHARSSKEPWSVNDILAHMRSCADVWGGSIEKMLAEDHPKLGYIHPRQWVKRTNYLELDFQESFKAYKAQRKKLLQLLKKLPFEAWTRGAIIQGREHTVFSQVRRISLHEGVHCEQIESLLQ